MLIGFGNLLKLFLNYDRIERERRWKREEEEAFNLRALRAGVDFDAPYGSRYF